MILRAYHKAIRVIGRIQVKYDCLVLVRSFPVRKAQMRELPDVGSCARHVNLVV